MTSYLDIFEAGKETSLGVGCRLRLELRHAACCVSAHTVYVYSLYYYSDLDKKTLQYYKLQQFIICTQHKILQILLIK